METPPQPPPSSSQPIASQSTDTLPSHPPPQQPPPSPPPPQQPPPSSLPSSIPPASTNPNPNPNPNPSTTIPPLSQQFNRSWSQPSPFSHFPPQFQPGGPSLPSTSSAPSSALLSSVTAPIPRGGIAIGVPAHHPTPPPSFVAPQYAGIPHNPVNVPDPVVPTLSPSTARPSMHVIPNMGMIGSQIRPGGIPPSVLNHQRPVQAPSNNLPPVSQNFQGHGILRASSMASPSTSTASTSQGLQTLHQPWLSSSVPNGRPPLPSQSFRPQVNSQSLQQRSHIPQQTPQPSLPTPPSHPQQLSSQLQQQPLSTPNQSQENHGQQLSSSRVPHPSANQQQITRAQGLGNPRPPSPAMVQPNSVQPNLASKTVSVEAIESCSKILSKRNIQELVYQIDPSENLDPEVEDVLVDIAEDFIDSVTTFGCSLAKHRKSNTLEARDILLHLDRNWNITLPGFSGDEIKTYKKPVANDTHKERLALIKKSLAATEVKNSAGPAAGNVKGHLAKATQNVVGS